MTTNCDYAPSSHPTARAEAALTHVATLLALATLLVNDLVFKSLWHGSWWTGKLSDLAWVIFSPPLLALPLTFFARRNPTAQRAAWVIAYIGLPLLYAAYNTFEPLRDVVMGGFSLLRGTPGGSPFDPTDSIVIPLGMATAIWVWRSAKIDSVATRMRLGLLVAALASVASVATTYPPTVQGIYAITTNADGEIRYHVGSDYSFRKAVRRVETSRGTFRIEDTNVTLSHEGKTEVVFSSIVKSKRRDSIALRASTRHLEGRKVSIAPYSIFYDERTGNVILAMGLQGVVVGTPGGRWERRAVGELKPLDYSISSRVSTLLDIDELLVVSAGLAASFMIFTLVLVTRSFNFDVGVAGAISLTLFGAGSIALLTFGIISMIQSRGDAGSFGLLLMALIPLAICAGFVHRASEIRCRDVLIMLAALIPSVPAVLGLMAFSDLSNATELVTPDLAVAFPIVAFFLSAPFVFALSRINAVPMMVGILMGFLAMILVSEFAFLLWVNGNFVLEGSKICSVLLVATVSVIFGIWMRMKILAESSKQRPLPPHGPTDGA